MPGVTIPPGSKPSTGGSGAQAGRGQQQRANPAAGAVPVPQPPAQTARQQQRPPSPIPPPVEPISPITKPAYLDGASTGSGTNYLPNFSAGRQSFTFSSPIVPPDSDATAVPPPRPVPLDLESNPDVLALRSAVAILQMQKKKAETDIVRLQRAKEAAMADPEAFAQDLAEGKVRKEGDRLFVSAQENEDRDDSGSGSDSDEDEEMADADVAGSRKPSGAAKAKAPAAPSWQELPQPQNVVRMPPVNWSKYGVVGDSLNKLHSEQLSRPTPGAPAVIGPGGSYEFKGGGGDQGETGKLIGVAAPYNPARDKLDTKPKGIGGSKR